MAGSYRPKRMPLAVEVPEYRNLLKEYIDGSLLYEVSVRKVWDRAAKDTEGLRDILSSIVTNTSGMSPTPKVILCRHRMIPWPT